MTRRVITIGENARLHDAIRLMLDNRISGLPVTGSGGELTGMLTEGDLLRRSETGTGRRRARWIEFLLGPGKLAAEYTRTHGSTVCDVMSRHPVTVAPDMPLAELVWIMEHKRIRRVPVLDGGRLVGIVTRANLMQALLAVAPEVTASPRSDEDIRRQLDAALRAEPWAMKDTINIVVRKGTVILSGAVADPRQRDAMRAAARNIPGVRAVRDELAWCDYLSGVVVDMAEVRHGEGGGQPH